MTSRELNIEIFPVFCFCITFLHYLFDRESWRETWRLFNKESWREVMIESHDEKTWRLFDKELWRMNKLFTTIYLSSCLDELNRKFKSILDFNISTQLKYLIQTSWLNLNTRFQNSDSNQVLMSWKLDLTWSV